MGPGTTVADVGEMLGLRDWSYAETVGNVRLAESEEVAVAAAAGVGAAAKGLGVRVGVGVGVGYLIVSFKLNGERV